MKFLVINRNTRKKEVFEVKGDTILIGRMESCDLVLASKTVSRKHAEIVLLNQDPFIVDLNSGNGTFLNNRKLTPEEKNLLRHNDSIRIEEFEIQPVLPEEKEEPEMEENTDSGIIEIKMIKKVLSALDNEKFPSLEVLDKPSKGVKVIFTNELEELVIGRDGDCNLTIDTNVISRRHAILQRRWGGITLLDLKSKNGTFVNQEPIRETVLKDGDEIMLGNIRILFRNPEDIDLEALSKEYEEKGDNASKPKPKEESGISNEAKISVNLEEEETEENEEEDDDEDDDEVEGDGDGEEEVREDEIEKEEDDEKEEVKKPKRFTSTERVLMILGVGVLIGALFALWRLLK